MALDDVADSPLVRRVTIAVQQDDDRDLGAERDQLLRRIDHICLGQRV